MGRWFKRGLVVTVGLMLAISIVRPLTVMAWGPDDYLTGIESGPESLTSNPVATFHFNSTAPEEDIRCQVDNGPVGPCASPYATSPLATGQHTFTVSIEGSTNWQSTQTWTWTIAIPITNCVELQSIGQDGDFPLDGTYILENDIDCDGQLYAPVGMDWQPFTGSLDGRGHTISNITTDPNAPIGGVFGTVVGASITSLHIMGIDGNTGNPNSGGLIGDATDVTISDVYAEDITASGGLIGLAQAGTNQIYRSFVSGSLSGYNAGGLISRTDGADAVVINDSYADVAVSGVNIGGLVGSGGTEITIQSSYARAELNSDGHERAGGLVGYGYGPTIADSFAIVTNDGDNAFISGGIVAAPGGAEYVSNSYFYLHKDNEDMFCDGGSNPSGCHEVDSPDYFLGDQEPAPTNEWDTSIWNLHEDGELPTFVVGVAQCDTPPASSDSITFRCQFQREIKHQYTGQQVSGEYRYRREIITGPWQYGTISEDGDIEITGLPSGRPYRVEVHATWGIGATNWGDSDNTVFFTTTPGPDSDFDGDGIPDAVEDAGPNDGDANGDRYDDSVTISGYDRDQANVTSFLNSVTKQYSVLQTDCDLNQGVSAITESTDNKDPAFDYDLGLISFSATGCGSTVTVTQYFFGNYDPGTYVARKYNQISHSYTTIPGATLNAVTIGNQTALKIEYQITDNGPFDQNPAIGSITDPVGPARNVVGTPNTGLGRAYQF